VVLLQKKGCFLGFDQLYKFALKRLRSEIGKEFLYHDVNHTVDVIKAARRLGKIEEIKAPQQVLIDTAALMHEIGMSAGYDLHEARSAEIAEEMLPEYGYSSADIEYICKLIMVTRFDVQPCDICEGIICDADLDYLGREDYFEIAGRLRDEWALLGVRVFTDEAWTRSQIEFMQRHQYYTNAASYLRRAGKADNLTKLHNELKSFG
jgi:predicted metal-dependent HD superfamily phosphohydrolase